MPEILTLDNMPQELAERLRSGAWQGRLDTEVKRTDDSQTVIFKRSLTAFLAQVLMSARQPLNGELLAPVIETDPDWVEETGYRVVDSVGRPKPLRGSGKDVPTVGLTGAERVRRVETFALAAPWNVKDFRQAEMAALMGAAIPLDMGSVDAMERSQNETGNDLIFYGDGDLRIVGLLNNPDILHQPFVDSIGTLVNINANSTPAQIRDAFGIFLKRVKNDTRRSFRANVVGIPSEAHTYLSITQNSDASDVTLLGWLEAAHPDVTFVEAEELEQGYATIPFGTSGTISDDFLIAADTRMPGYGQRRPMGFELMELYRDGPYGFLLPSLMRCGSVQVPYSGGVQVAQNVLGRRIETGT